MENIIENSDFKSSTSELKEYKCAFTSTLVTEHFACDHAEQVVHRGGAEIACQDSSATKRCSLLFNCLKQELLPVFNVADDLLTMPHSVVVKIQHGGLIGLKQLVGDSDSTIPNIDALVKKIIAHFGTLDKIPYQQIIDVVSNYKTRKRRR